MAHDLVAGYWSDIDFRNGFGGYTATVHESNDTDKISLRLFNETRLFLEKFVNLTDFSPSTIVLGTWYKGNPFPSSNYRCKAEVMQK